MKESTRIARFTFIGTLNALITALVAWGMMYWVGANYLIANAVAYVVAQTHNFVWSKYWIFPTNKKSNTWLQVLLFCMVFGLAYTAQFLFLLVLVEWLDFPAYPAQLLGLIIYGAVNFVLNKRITFNQ